MDFSPQSEAEVKYKRYKPKFLHKDMVSHQVETPIWALELQQTINGKFELQSRFNVQLSQQVQTVQIHLNEMRNRFILKHNNSSKHVYFPFKIE